MEVKTLFMTFKNEKGDNVSLSVKGIKDNLTSEEITNAMDIIITKDAFFTSGGKLVRKAGAQIVKKNVDQYEVG